MNRLQERYNKEIQVQLKEELGIKNANAIPKLEKITLNVGVGKAQGDKKVIENVESTLQRITGQKPVATKARKSISNFKLRQGTIVGLSVTLRGERMYAFMDKLVNVTLPRVRDFQGINRKSVDSQGSLNIGFKEHIVFPEIKSDEVEHVHGLEVAITTTAHSTDHGIRLLEKLGVPFKQDN